MISLHFTYLPLTINMHTDIRNDTGLQGTELGAMILKLPSSPTELPYTAHAPQSLGLPNAWCWGQKERGPRGRQALRTADLEHKESMLAQAVFALVPIACHMNYKHIPFKWMTCNKTIHRIPRASFFRLSPHWLCQVLAPGWGRNSPLLSLDRP